MGGKEQGVLAAQAIVAQMKQQQIVMVSWKATKPYQYIRGESRTYAVIPYESVLTIAGKSGGAASERRAWLPADCAHRRDNRCTCIRCCTRV